MSTDVSGIITAQQGYVTSWTAQADSFINTVAGLADADFDVEFPDSLGFEVADRVGDVLSELLTYKPTRPDFSGLDDLGDVPDAPDVAPLDLPDISIPDFGKTAPVLDIPAAPKPDFGTPPTIPSVTQVALPSAPSLAFPVAPTTAAITLPAAPSIELPFFNSSLPINDLVTPSATFDFAEERYSSALLDAAKAKLLDDLENGGYGIEPADEQALFERARSRELANSLDEVDQTLEGFAARGCPLEPGESAVALGHVYQRAHDKISDANRTITLERSRLYVENRQFTLREARELETILIQYHTALMERTLNAARAVLDAAIAIYNTTVSRYNARVAAYQAEAQVYEQRIRASLSQVEIYKAQIQAANLTLESQRTAVEIYRAQLAGVQSLVDVYRTQVEAANVVAQVQRVQMDAARASIEAYGANVQAQVAVLNGYEAQIRGQIARVDGFKGEVEGYVAQVNGAKARAETFVAKANAETERARVQLAGYQAKVAGFTATADAKLREITANADVYRADAAAYTAVADVVKGKYSLILQDAQTNNQWNLGVQESKTRIAIGKLEKVRAVAQLRLGASEFGAGFYKDVIAATLGSINTLAATIENV